MRKKNTVVRSLSFAGLGEHDSLAIARHISQQRPVKPCQAALAGFAGRKGGKAHARLVGGQQNQSGAADVVQRQPARSAVNQPFLARKIQRVDRALRSAGHRREPYFLAVRSPGQSFYAGIKRRTRFHIAMRVDDDYASIVPAGDMIDDREKISVGREAHMADPAPRLVNHIANRKFQVQLSERAWTNHRQRLSVGRPVSPKHLVKHFARSASRQWYACQSSALREGTGGAGMSARSPSRLSKRWKGLVRATGRGFVSRCCRSAWKRFPGAGLPTLRRKQWSAHPGQSALPRSYRYGK